MDLRLPSSSGPPPPQTVTVFNRALDLVLGVGMSMDDLDKIGGGVPQQGRGIPEVLRSRGGQMSLSDLAEAMRTDSVATGLLVLELQNVGIVEFSGPPGRELVRLR